MTNWIFNLIEHFGYLAVAVLIAIENIFPPIPSEVILSFSGFWTSKSDLNIFGLIIASTIGSVVGALILYWIGSFLNERKLEKIFSRKLFIQLGFKKSDVTNSIAWFDKYGMKSIFFGRCIPVIRSLISIPAGIAKVKLPMFIFLTTLGSLIWNSILLFLGSYTGNNWHVIVAIFEEYTLIVIILIIFFMCILIYRWYKKRINTK